MTWTFEKMFNNTTIRASCGLRGEDCNDFDISSEEDYDYMIKLSGTTTIPSVTIKEAYRLWGDMMMQKDKVYSDYSFSADDARKIVEDSTKEKRMEQTLRAQRIFDIVIPKIKDAAKIGEFVVEVLLPNETDWNTYCEFCEMLRGFRISETAWLGIKKMVKFEWSETASKR